MIKPSELDSLKRRVGQTRQACLYAMDRRLSKATLLMNIYFKMLHDYRMELRRVRKAGESK